MDSIERAERKASAAVVRTRWADLAESALPTRVTNACPRRRACAMAAAVEGAQSIPAWLLHLYCQ